MMRAKCALTTGKFGNNAIFSPFAPKMAIKFKSATYFCLLKIRCCRKILSLLSSHELTGLLLSRMIKNNIQAQLFVIN